MRTAEQPAAELDLEELERVARAAARHDDGWTLETAETSPHLAEDPASSVHLPLDVRWTATIVTRAPWSVLLEVVGNVTAVPDRARHILAFQPRVALALLAEMRRLREGRGGGC
ncbi:hypothetical protein [Myxococcus eversor]|uniref:hypothetical protein n=1 Tax=Myxococcus eversor TaxID=2709661 RepID=UPI0013D46072|nr:hypothetical protein [Myxococcus eversor]